MTKDELDRTLEMLREKYRTSDPALRKQITHLANHAKWLYERDSENETVANISETLL